MVFIGLHTEDTNGTSTTDEDAQRSDVLSGEGVLHGRCEQTNSTSEHGRLHGCRDGILGMVAVIVLVVRHDVFAGMGLLAGQWDVVGDRILGSSSAVPDRQIYTAHH